MRFSLYSSKLTRVMKHRNLFIRLAFYELGIILILIATLVYAFTSQRTIITPPVVQRSFWIENNHVSEAYLAEMSNFFISLRFNLSPANAAIQRDVLLRYIDPRYYTHMKSGLTAEAEQMKKQNISVAFYPLETKVNTKNLQAFVTGDVISLMGQTVLPVKRATFSLSYRYQNGNLWINHFEEVKTDEKK